MNRLFWPALSLLLLASPACAHILPRPFELDRLNRKLCGKVLDHTHNHGRDRRIWSNALCEKRDVYVYVPPGYCRCKRYPVIFFLHGFRQDEKGFLEDVVKPIDRAMATGCLPPAIVVVPDASIHGIGCFVTHGTFYLNSNLGRFEDFLVNDVYDFAMKCYPIRPEPEAHVLLGVSMGGGAAFSKAIKYQHKFKVAAAVFPPLNLRWISCRDKYMDNFDPCCWGWRTDFNRGRDVVGRFFGVITIRLRSVIYPLYGRNNPNTLNEVISNNPAEMLSLYNVKPGDLEMYVCYGGKDQFNLDAQIESFLFCAKQRGLDVGVGYDPKGQHNVKTALKLFPGLCHWLKPRLEPYSPK